MNKQLVKLKDRIEYLQQQLHEKSSTGLWYWYRENPRRCINHPNEDVMITAMQALDYTKKLIEDILEEGNEKKKLEKIAKLYALSKPAFDEAKRVIKLGSIVNRLDSMRKNVDDDRIRNSLTECYEKAIGMYQSGAPAPMIEKLAGGTYRLRTSEDKKESMNRKSETSEESNSDSDANTATLSHQLSSIRLDGLYIGGLQRTIDSLSENLRNGTEYKEAKPDEISNRAEFWISFSEYADIIESRMAEAVESMKPVEVSDIPAEFLIPTLRVYNHSFKDFPLRYEPINARLIPG